MLRCLECGCSRLDPLGIGCAVCGKSLGPRWERCYITENTERVLLAHEDALREFGITLSEEKPLKKGADAIAVAGLVLAVAESMRNGILRDLIVCLHEWGVTRNEIQRLRLTEPEDVNKTLSSGERRE